jgi:hypothetical protein
LARFGILEGGDAALAGEGSGDFGFWILNGGCWIEDDVGCWILDGGLAAEPLWRVTSN